MRMDRRVKHGVEVRKEAAELFASGMGSCTVASTLSVPLPTEKEQQHIYHAFGSEILMIMDDKQTLYTYEQKVAAARAVIEGDMTKTEAMAKFKIMSLAPLERWCRLYRTGGAEALKPKPKGRSKGSKSKPQKHTHEQELEEHCRRLETEVAYLKKCAPWSRKTSSSEEERSLTLSLSKLIWTHMLCTGIHKGVRLN